jgi:peptide/nickel transport system substrate-binding protein
MATVRFTALVSAALLLACRGETGRSAGGTVAIAAGSDPGSLIPALVQTTTAAEIVDMIYDRLADIGDSLNIVGDGGFTPRLADRWTWSRDSLSIAFHLNPNARWHDGQPVRSNDVRFTIASTKDSSLAAPTASVITNIDSVSTPDSATAVFWFHTRSPQQFYDAVFQNPIIPEHVWKGVAPAGWRGSAQAKTPIGSGQYRFVRWIPSAAVELAADTANYRGSPKIRRLIWSIAPDFNTLLARFMAGEIDVFENLRPENVAAVQKQRLGVNLKPWLAYTYMSFNLRDPGNRDRPHPLFGSRDLRRALTMATDRAAIVRATFDTLALPALGPTVRAYPSTDPKLRQIPFDLAAARKTLDSLGWRLSGGDSVRVRNGRPLRFSISVPATSALRVKMAVLIQEQLRHAGVQVDVEQLALPAMIDKAGKHTFDALIGQWNTQPSPGAVRGSWGTAASRANGNNWGSYESPAFDAYVDSAVNSFDVARQRQYFTKAYETINQDAAAIWLAEPRQIFGYHSRLQLAGMRADSWWAHLADWWIPADKRIARDSIPPSPADTTPPAESAGKKTP